MINDCYGLIYKYMPVVSNQKPPKNPFEVLVEISPDAITKTDLNGNITFASTQTAKLHGYDDPKDLIGRNAAELIDPREHERVKENMSKTLAEGSVRNVEYVMVRKDGTQFQALLSASVVIGEGGQPEGFVAYTRDISDLKEVQRRLQDIVMCSADWIWEVDKEGTYTFAAGKVKEILGYSQEELLGKTPFDLMPAEEAHRVGEIFKGIAGAKRLIVDLENWNKTKDGKLVCLVTNGTPVLDAKGNLVGYRGIDKDITAQKRAVSELARQKEIAEMYLNVVGNMIVALDSSGKISLMNKKGHDVLGHNEGELVGKDWFATCIPEEQRDEVRTVFGKLMAGEIKPTEYYENAVVAKSGEERLIAWHNAILHDEKGKIIGTLSSGEDITDRRKVEEELKKSKDALQLKVDELEKFNKLTVGRELKMAEMKKEIEMLKKGGDKNV